MKGATMSGRAGHRSLGWVLLVVTISALTACGGSSKSSSSTSTSTVPTAVDTSADAAAMQATVALADLGAGWTQYRKASGFEKSGATNCNVKFGSPVKASDRIYAAPMFRDVANQSYVYSFAYVFRTEAGAKAYTAARRTQVYTQCKVTQDDAAAKKADAKAFVRIKSTTDPAVVQTGGLESFYQEEAGAKNADGAETVTADYDRYAFRQGRVVYVIYIDTGLPNDEAGRQALATRLTTALSSATAAINGRLSALHL
jgi:hypothetical protein